MDDTITIKLVIRGQQNITQHFENIRKHRDFKTQQREIYKTAPSVNSFRVIARSDPFLIARNVIQQLNINIIQLTTL